MLYYQIGVRTVKRILTRIRQGERRLPRRGPERALQVLRQIPAQRIAWDIGEPVDVRAALPILAQPVALPAEYRPAMRLAA